jgi:Mlc titration factor MtfA (ptsG expression regulator)
LFSILKNWRRHRILSKPLPKTSVDLIRQNVWQYSSLNSNQQTRVQNCAQVMSAEKTWEGIDGLVVNDEVKLTISATAALLTLGLAEPFYFDQVRTIIVYPGPIKNRTLARGLLQSDEESFYSGLAWQGGPLVFSWASSLKGSQRSGDGANVIIHEFIHHIDGMDGEMGGTPIIESDELRDEWLSVFKSRYEELIDNLNSNQRPRIDEYAATNMAEFFAVAGESFFDSPGRLKHELPDVYEVLQKFFDINPIEFEN